MVSYLNWILFTQLPFTRLSQKVDSEQRKVVVRASKVMDSVVERGRFRKGAEWSLINYVRPMQIPISGFNQQFSIPLLSDLTLTFLMRLV